MNQRGFLLVLSLRSGDEQPRTLFLDGYRLQLSSENLSVR